MYKQPKKTQNTVCFCTWKAEIRAPATRGKVRNAGFNAAIYARPANYMPPPPKKKKKQFQRTTNKPNMPKKSCIFIAMLLHHRFEHLRVPFVSGLQAIKGAMYQGHEFRIAPRPAEILTARFFCGSILFLWWKNFDPRDIFFGGRVGFLRG